jgi:hypothetical protein
MLLNVGILRIGNMILRLMRYTKLANYGIARESTQVSQDLCSEAQFLNMSILVSKFNVSTGEPKKEAK